MTDITLLTCQAYYKPDKITPYIQNILDEEQLLKAALEKQDLSVDITYWDNSSYSWNETRCILFRTVWDYFKRLEKFLLWLEEIKGQTKLVNSYDLIKWNIDKHYLKDLQGEGIQIVPTFFAEKNCVQSLDDISTMNNWSDLVIKPAISASAFKTYKILNSDINNKEKLFQELLHQRDMLVQPYINTIEEFGEASLMVFNGNYSHAVLKKAKLGDFRVQDDFGGTVNSYDPTKEEIAFAEKVFQSCKSMPLYGRIDIVWDENRKFYLSELEIIEPELWIRKYPKSAERIAEAVKKIL